VESVAPVAETAARLAALDPYAGFEVAPVPSDDWVRLAEAEDAGHLDAWLTTLVARHGRRNVAGSMLGCQLSEAVIGPTVAPLLLDGRCPDPSAANLAVRVDADGNLDAHAVMTTAAAVLPGDPLSTHRDSVVLADEAALDDWWAFRAAATLTPLLAAVRARAPFGLSKLWGEAADTVAGTMIWIAQLAGRDATAAWDRAQRLLDALARHTPAPFVRGASFPVAYPGGCQLFQVRGTCCLYYRSAVETGPPAETYCNTCPLRDDDSRHRRLRDYLVATQPEPAA
jgi:hypothetical protein